MISVVPVSPRPRWLFRKSAAVSPTVVAMILMIQKKSVTSGTLLSMVRAGEGSRFGWGSVVSAMDAGSHRSGEKLVTAAVRSARERFHRFSVDLYVAFRHRQVGDEAGDRTGED